MNTNAKPTIVIVHGAFADASSWNEVIERLQQQGYDVIAPPNPLRGVRSDSAYLASLLNQVDGPILLVAHSYGGAVTSNAAARQMERRHPSSHSIRLTSAGALPPTCPKSARGSWPLPNVPLRARHSPIPPDRSPGKRCHPGPSSPLKTWVLGLTLSAQWPSGLVQRSLSSRAHTQS